MIRLRCSRNHGERDQIGTSLKAAEVKAQALAIVEDLKKSVADLERVLADEARDLPPTIQEDHARRPDA